MIKTSPRGCRFGMSALIWQTRVFRDPEGSGRDPRDPGILDFFFSQTRVFRDPEGSFGFFFSKTRGGIQFFFVNTCLRDSEGSGGLFFFGEKRGHTKPATPEGGPHFLVRNLLGDPY